MIFLGIDYGSKYIGLSWASQDLCIPFPLPFILNNESRLEVLKKIVKEREIDEFVLGNPLSMDGNETKMSKEVQLFAKEIELYFDKKVHLIEEQLSTYQAGLDLSEMKQNKKSNNKKLSPSRSKFCKKKPKNGTCAQIDSFSAVVILRDFLERFGMKNF